MIFALRMPVFPVILDAGNSLITARTEQQLAEAIIKLQIRDSEKRRIIDLNADLFQYHPKLDTVAPGFVVNRITKKTMIELYKQRRHPSWPPIRETSLSSRTLGSIIFDIVELVENSQE